MGRPWREEYKSGIYHVIVDNFGAWHLSFLGGRIV